MLSVLRKRLFLLLVLFLCLNGATKSTSNRRPWRVLYIMQYPQISETYKQEEIASVWNEYEIKIISVCRPDLQPKNFFPHDRVDSARDITTIDNIIQEFQPDVMHSHYLPSMDLLTKLAYKHKIPFTVRSHSFDILCSSDETLKSYAKFVNDEWCLRVLCFPPFRNRLIQNEFAENKVVSCWPVINYQRFYNSTPRQLTGKVLNVGATLVKKDYKSFIDLATNMKESGLEFNLYVLGYKVDKIKSYNKEQGNPVTHITYVEPEEMPLIYRNHDWLVYTADPSINTVGFPMAIAEAQASGIGICWQELPGRREEQLEYLGGAGFLFKSIKELPNILNKPYPESMRLIGLENAKKCDIEQHKILLTEVWDSV